MSARTVKFADLVEMIDRLPLDERHGLVDLVSKRIAEDERERIVKSVRAAKLEHKRGRCRPVTPEELMREILA